MPGCWCDWEFKNIKGHDGTKLRWGTGEKFYAFTYWLQYLIDVVQYGKWRPLVDTPMCKQAVCANSSIVADQTDLDLEHKSSADQFRAALSTTTPLPTPLCEIVCGYAAGRIKISGTITYVGEDKEDKGAISCRLALTLTALKSQAS